MCTSRSLDEAPYTPSCTHNVVAARGSCGMGVAHEVVAYERRRLLHHCGAVLPLVHEVGQRMSPGRPQDPPWAIFVTCVVSHAPMLLTPLLLHRRRLYFECVVALYAVLVSFMYHTCECFGAVVFLSELQWHRLDNIGAITSLMITSIHLACLDNVMLESYLKFGAFAGVLVAQEGYPWDIRYTIAPVVLAAAVPVVSHACTRHRRRMLVRRHVMAGGVSFAIAIVFFLLGLDDAHDPFRSFHGLFHFFIAFSAYSWWLSMRHSPRKLRADNDTSAPHLVIST